MSNIITIGFHREGTTDERFLRSIIKRTFDDVALECQSEIEVYDPEVIIVKGDKFVDTVSSAAKLAYSQGIMVLCIHVDADDSTDRKAFLERIDPAFNSLSDATDISLLVAVVPVHMTEAWMMADKDLLVGEIGTQQTVQSLGFSKSPESYNDPKKAIEDAIRLSYEHRARRHRHQLTIGELYQPIGQKIKIEKLEALPSYVRFKESVRESFRKLNYLS